MVLNAPVVWLRKQGANGEVKSCLCHATTVYEIRAALRDSQILTSRSLPFFRILIQFTEEQ